MIYTFGVLFESDEALASSTESVLGSEMQSPLTVDPNAGVVAAVLVEEDTSNPEEIVEEGVIPKSDGDDKGWLEERGGGGRLGVCCWGALPVLRPAKSIVSPCNP